MRYYSHNATKNLGMDEARALGAAGLQLGTVWESAGTHAGFFSRAQGQLDGAAALQEARATGQPEGSAIYFAVDYDPPQPDIDGPAADYFAAVTGFAGSKTFAGARRYDLIQALLSIIKLDGGMLDIDPDTTNPDGDPGLFQPA